MTERLDRVTAVTRRPADIAQVLMRYRRRAGCALVVFPDWITAMGPVNAKQIPLEMVTLLCPCQPQSYKLSRPG